MIEKESEATANRENISFNAALKLSSSVTKCIQGAALNTEKKQPDYLMRLF